MLNTNFTPAQQNAIKELNCPLVVTAGPGAGKTRVLTERFLYLLEQSGVSVENIVAITFTNKAANEMRERIRQRIDEQIEANKGKASELHWRQHKRQLEAAAIGTIHGFCSRLLHEFPLAARIDPTFTTLDEYTAALMLDQAAQQAVTGAIDQGDRLVAELVVAYGRATLVTELKQVFSQLRSLGIPLDAAQRITADNTLKSDAYTYCWQAVGQRVRELQNAVAEGKRAKKSGSTMQAAENFLAVWREETNSLQASPSLERLPTFLDALARLRQALPDARGNLGEAVEPLQKLLGTRSKGGGKLEAIYFDICAREYQEVVFKVLRRIASLYTEAKNKVAALDFEDLQLRAHELLQAQGIRQRVRDRYRHFLVDEFQDTNHLQRKLLDALGLETFTAGSGGNQTFFFVGDRKQSIYAFRGAEVEVFDETVEKVTEKGGRHLRLDVNFRSDPRLINFFNALFSRIMVAPNESHLEPPSAVLRQSGFVAHEPSTAHRQALDTDRPAVVFLCTEALKDEKKPALDESLRDIEAERLARYVQELVEKQVPLVQTNQTKHSNTAQPTPRPPTYRDIAFLFGALTNVKTYEHALRQAGVPCYVVAGHGFYERPEVSDLLNLLAFLDNRADDLALAGVLRSPLFGLSDEMLLWLRWAPGAWSGRWVSLYHHLRLEAEKQQAGLSSEQRALLQEAVTILEELLAVRNRLPLPDLIEQAIRRTGYDIVCAGAEDGPQRLSNLDKLIALARSFASRETHLLRDFVAYIREFRRLDAREAEAQLELGLNAVALLTIHKSKGLEFPIVVLPDLQRRWRQGTGKFVFERNCGLGFDVPDQLGRRYPTVLKSKVLERIGRREQFERMRQLYVAMTRAQDALILSAAVRTTSRSGVSSTEATSFLDWLAPWLLPKGDVEGDSALAPSPPAQSPAEATVLQLDQARIQLLRNSQFAAVETVSPANPPEPPSQAVFIEQVQSDARRRELEQLILQLKAQLEPVAPDPKAIQGQLHYSVSQLTSFAHCPRKYYFARFLDPLADETRQERQLVQDTERPEAQARLSPAIRGLIVHKLCEDLQPEDNDPRALRAVLQRAVAFLRADGRLEDVALDDETLLQDVWWLATRYAESHLRKEIDAVQRQARESSRGYEVWSERLFTIRCGAALVTGVIDKVLITPCPDGRGVIARIVDFKTNAFESQPGQPGFEGELTEKVAWYRLQLQIYALALWKLLPNVQEVHAMLHFLVPDHTVVLPVEQTGRKAAAHAVEEVINALASIRTFAETDFKPNPGARCMHCRYAGVCADAIREAVPAVQMYCHTAD
ncbi:MAG: UvrD-helicase domain-containing protein [Acidobacteriota bacterium]